MPDNQGQIVEENITIKGYADVSYGGEKVR